MGWITHFLAFGTGVFLGTKLNTPSRQQDDAAAWIKVNTSGIQVGEKNVVKITDDKIDVWDGFMEYDRKK